MLENRAPHVVAGDYAPRSSVDIWPEDLGVVLDIARGAKFSAPLTAAALQQFLAASGSGLGGEDDAAVAKVYARNAGLTLPGGSLVVRVAFNDVYLHRATREMAHLEVLVDGSSQAHSQPHFAL